LQLYFFDDRSYVENERNDSDKLKMLKKQGIVSGPGIAGYE